MHANFDALITPSPEYAVVAADALASWKQHQFLKKFGKLDESMWESGSYFLFGHDLGCGTDYIQGSRVTKMCKRLCQCWVQPVKA